MSSPLITSHSVTPSNHQDSSQDSAISDSPTSEHSHRLPHPEPHLGDNYRNKEPSYLIISGGTGANSIAGAFGHSPSFVLPVSDDGGSSSEILRCFGGPSIGDIRSRLTRVIPVSSHPSTKAEKERVAIYNLMAFRFPSESEEKAVRDMWMEIVEGKSELWDGIGEDKKECLRAFLVHFETQCLKRAHKRFSFRNFSLGNGFLTGARDLFGSLPSAIFLFKSIAGVAEGVQVIPVINTNQTVTIAAQLTNSTTLVGQCAISHPSPNPSSSPTTSAHTPIHGSHSPAAIPIVHPILRSHLRRDSRTFDTPDTSAPPTRGHSHDRLADWKEEGSDNEGKQGSNLGYKKGEEEVPLEAKVERVFYINLYGQEIYPDPNHDFIDALHQRDVLVYSCGSLWTSIVPCLALKGLAGQIASSRTLRAKVLLLNSANDRETTDYAASEYVATILAMLRHYDKPKRNRVRDQLLPAPEWKAENLISHVVYLEGGKVPIDEGQITQSGIQMVCVPSDIHGAGQGDVPMFSNEAVQWAMAKVLEGLSQETDQ
ncbi:hypothetical protein B9479_000688 [Cryptococcus floricola]|uniref:Uncharacterized protein n=1 Tax=Cryptococcus floricola TaxID=2591691 RepID=A0A5D3B7B8_9TREE|nr:hypothetical protein B9479_000688 [Cryptococcus floricola]